MRIEDLTPRTTTIVYDGACPFCRRYADVMTRTTLPNAVCIDARKDRELVDDAFARGIDLDGGMMVIRDGSIHHGADAMRYLGTQSTHGNKPIELIHAPFRARPLAKPTYAVLRTLRNLWLRLRGIQPLGKR